jgi:competence protein ComEC
MAAVIGYALFLGAPPAILRATMMASLLVLAPVFGRQPGGIGTLMLTGLVLTAADPQIVSDLSFQLSFAAVGGLMVLSAPISEGLRELSAGVRLSVPGVLIEVLAVTTAAWLATLPIIAINFDKLSLIGIGANLFVAPAFTPMLLSALLTIPASYLPGSAGLLLAWPAWVLFGYFRWVGESASALPTASIAVSGFTSIHAIVLYTAVAVVTWLLGAKRPLLEADQLPALRPGAVVYVPALVLLNLLIWPNVFDGESDKLRVSFLDVGQGDAILVEAPDGQRVLIDGGPDPARLIQELDEELGFGSRRIDLLVLTHMATDHATGTIAVLERYDVELVAWSGLDDGSDLAAVWRDAVEESGAELLSLAAGNEFVVDELAVTALWPPREMANDLVENEASIVLRLSYDDVVVLVTGDIGLSTEAALLAQGVLLEADVLKVAHHGSAGSSLQEFLAAVGPQYAVIQSGASNPFGHPAAPVLARLDRAGATVLRNDVEGTITLVTDGETIWRD